MTDIEDREQPGAWTFAQFGAQFDSHVIAHLPVYEDVQAIVAGVSSYTLPDRGVIADLGASTGRTIAQLAEQHPERRLVAHLYDADPSMLQEAERRLVDHGNVTGYLHAGDLTEGDTWSHQRADLTLALWLLQFIHPRHRVEVLKRARDRAADNGVILLGAKARHLDSRWQEIADGALADYKAAAGVTPQEIVAKARSLRGVLIPDTGESLAGHLVTAGWHAPTVIHRWHVWTLIGAWASPR